MKLFSKYSNLCEENSLPQRHGQTDRQTDRQTDGRTTYCGPIFQHLIQFRENVRNYVLTRYSLNLCLRQLDLIETYKFINNKYNPDPQSLFLYHTESYVVCGHEDKIRPAYSNRLQELIIIQMMMIMMVL